MQGQQAQKRPSKARSTQIGGHHQAWQSLRTQDFCRERICGKSKRSANNLKHRSQAQNQTYRRSDQTQGKRTPHERLMLQMRRAILWFSAHKRGAL